MQSVTRFAPSPTGRLHLGHACSALLAHDFARERGGAFLLRIEDIDPGRSRPEHVDGIIEDLRWLGLAWDGEPVYQSERLPLYAEALERLKAAGLRLSLLLHPRRHRRQRRAPRRMDPRGRSIPAPAAAFAEARDARRRAACLAARHGEGRGAGRAARAGPTMAPRSRAEPERFGDVVLARKDAPASYHLAVTVDDAAQGVTDVVRGRDLFAATHVHRLLQALLGLPTPAYHHHRLLADADGRAPRQARTARRRSPPCATGGADPAALVGGAAAGRIAGWLFARRGVRERAMKWLLIPRPADRSCAGATLYILIKGRRRHGAAART